MSEYNFSKEELEEVVIIAALKNKHVLPKIAALPEDIFKDDYLRWMFVQIKTFYKKYRKPIKQEIMLSEMDDDIEEKKQKLYRHTIEDMYDAGLDDNEDVEYSLAAMKTLVNRRSILSKVDEIIDKLKMNDVETAVQMFRQPLSDIMIDMPEHKTISFDEDSWHKRSKRRLSDSSKFQNRFKFELYDDNDDFDTLAKNTYVKGRNGLWLAPAKGGKTTMAVHCATRGAFQGLNVLVIDRENGGDLIEDRIDATLFDLPIDKIEDGSFLKNVSVKTIAAKREKLQKINNRIEVIFMPSSTVWDLYALLEQYRYDKNWIPDVIIDDYPAMMRGKNNNNKTQYIEDRYKEFDTVLRGNSQLDQPSYMGISFIHTIADVSSEEYTPQDVSWAKNVGQKVDGLNGLLRNSDEREDNLARLQFLFGRHWGTAEGKQICVNFIGETCSIRPMRKDEYI